MYSLYRLLFNSSYWKMLIRRATWSEAKTSLRRAHKDNRARKHLLAFLLMLLVPFLCLAYLAWLAGSGALLFVPFILPVIWWRSKRAKQDDVPLNIVPPPQTVVVTLSDEQIGGIRLYFSELSLLLAVLVARAGSEAFLKQKVLPEGFEVTSRRVHLDLLRTHGIWERTAQADREAMMTADGHWEWAVINDAWLAIEPLRLLRWILRIDFYLPVIGQQLKLDSTLASELVHTPQRAFQGKDVADIPLIRIGRDAAQEFYYRCVAEAVNRGYLETRYEKGLEWAKNVSEALSGKQNEDLVLDGKLVSEVSREELLWALSLSQKRMEFLNWTISLLGGATLSETFPGVLHEEHHLVSAADNLSTSGLSVE
jgi:hypothetical protein